MITQYWETEVEIPEAVYRTFGHTSTYANHVSECIKGFIEAGSNTYSTPYEWATFATRTEAEACEVKLRAMIRFFQEHL